MTVRYPAQCRRTVQRAVPGSSQGIWVTDSMLRQAIEQYQRTLAPKSRQLSSHKGPIESRRRLGKRHMTGAMPMMPYTPTWHFDVIPSIVGWQWQPPTTSRDRKNKKRDISPSALFNGFIGWLEKSDAGKPFLTPPPTYPDQNTIKMMGEAVAEAVPYRTMDVFVSEQLGTPQAILDFRSSIIQQSEHLKEQLYHLSHPYYEAVRHRLLSRTFSKDELQIFMEPIDDITKIKIGDTRKEHIATRVIGLSVIEAIRDVSLCNPTMVPDSLWIALVEQVSKPGSHNRNLQQLEQLVSSLPNHIRAQHLSPTQLRNMFVGFLSLQASKVASPGRWCIRAQRAGNILGQLTSEQKSTLTADVMMGSMDRAHQGLQDTTKRLEFAWLVACAYDTHAEFTHTIRRVDASELELTSMQIYQLTVARLSALGHLDKEQHDHLLSGKYAPRTWRWSDLIKFTTASSAATNELHEILTLTRGRDAIIKDLASSPKQRLQMDAIRALAANCKDYQFALRLYDTIHAKHPETPLAARWGWRTWTNHVESIIQDPLEEHRLLRIFDMSQSCRRRQRLSVREIAERMSLIDRIADAYLNATYLTDRQILRRIEACANFQRTIGSKLSAKMVVNVMSIVTKDLESGQWGRTRRLEMLVQTVEKQCGPEISQQVLRQLRKWRSAIDTVGDGVPGARRRKL